MAEHDRNAKNATVVHNASKQRFEINIDGQLSVLEYTFKNHRLFLTHTEVPPALESQGLGGASSCCIGICAPERVDCRCGLPFCAGIRKQSPGISVVCDHFGCLNQFSCCDYWATLLSNNIRMRMRLKASEHRSGAEHSLTRTDATGGQIPKLQIADPYLLARIRHAYPSK